LYIYINIYKEIQSTFHNLTNSSSNQKLELSDKTDSENHLFGHSILENQIQALSRTCKSPDDSEQTWTFTK